MESRETRLRRAQQIDDLSGALITFGTKVIKKNPVIVSSYVIGLLICLFFSGIALTAEQRVGFERDISSIDYISLDEATTNYQIAYERYSQSKGFFSCDAKCQSNKRVMEDYRNEMEILQKQVDSQMSDAKSKLGIFSEVGVGETRDLFWTRFGQGKNFATRQTKWDALFMGLSAMGRDENIVSYLFRLILTMAFNFTIGMIGAVIGFLWSIVSIIRSYQTPLYAAVIFFTLAAISAIAFAVTWIIGLYLATAGTVYVGAKLVAANLRIEDGGQYNRQPQAQHYQNNYSPHRD